MSKALEAFEDITPANSQVTSTLQKLFAAIDRQCRKEEKYEDEVAGNGSKRKHANLAKMNGAFERLGLGGGTPKRNAECRFGDKCKFGKDCRYGHPNGFAKDQRNAKEYVDKNKNTTAGKCEGNGCPETKLAKRLCTTCFSKACEHGSIKLKGGGSYKPPPKAAIKRAFSVKSTKQAWKAANADNADNSNDDTIPGSGGPKSKKQKKHNANAANAEAGEVDTDLTHRMDKMAKFAKTLEGMGMKFD